MSDPAGPAAVAGITAVADCLDHGWDNGCMGAALNVFRDSDVYTVGYIAGLLVNEVGEPAREALRQLGVRAALGADWRERTS